MRSSQMSKLFFLAGAAFLFIFIYVAYNEENDKRQRELERTRILNELYLKMNAYESIQNETVPAEDDNKLKYILQWTNPKNVPFVYMGVGQAGFISRNCRHTNCYVTGDRNFLADVTKFDLIAFAGPEVVYYGKNALPDKRSPHQKYVFASIESADNYPLCNDNLENFFNWTWTYKLDSDARWGYLVVRDSDNKIIGPNTIMNWMKLEDVDPVGQKVKETLEKKTKAAAWFVSNCNSRSQREMFVNELQKHLAKFNLGVDIYGRCGPLTCSRDLHDECVKKLKSDYYFYLAFENSFSEDYVTEKLLHGLQNNAVPIVYGGANYTRFMPDGIYLNAREFTAQSLAKRMWELIQDPEAYQQFFRWKNHYSYHSRSESVETDDYCRFCSLMNEIELVKQKKVYNTFRQWWTPPGRC